MDLRRKSPFNTYMPSMLAVVVERAEVEMLWCVGGKGRRRRERVEDDDDEND